MNSSKPNFGESVKASEALDSADNVGNEFHPPPPYKEYDDSSEDESSDNSEVHATANLPLPCVIPQTTKAFRGAFFSPFVRAYSPDLAACGIDKAAFATFIDGLNECFVAHPLFQGLNIAGQVLSMFYGLNPVQWAGAGLQVTAGVASFATSYLRTRAYVKATNADLFHPAGLHLHILTTKKMMQKVGAPEEKLQLPPLEFMDDVQDFKHLKPKEAAAALVSNSVQDDPRMRRVRALEGYVAPLDLDVPDSVPPDSLFAKMGHAQANRMSRKQNKKLVKGHKKYIKKSRRVERKQDRVEANQARLEVFSQNQSPDSEERASTIQIQELDLKQKAKLEKKIAKGERKLEKKMGKADKALGKIDKKESKVANKIRWIVIAPWAENDDSDDDSLPEEGDETTGVV